MSKEIRLSLLAILTLVLVFWGYKFVKGKNIFQNTKTFYAVFDNVQQLTVSSPIYMNGYEIGVVSGIKLNPDNVKSLIVTLEVDGKIGYPKDTKVALTQASIVSGKVLSLEFDRICNGDCAQDGDYLHTKSIGMIESMLGTDDISEYSSVIRESVSGAIDSLFSKLSDRESDNPLNQTLFKMQETMDNLATTTSRLNQLMRTSSGSLETSLSNMATLSNGLAASTGEIQSLITNMNAITSNLRDADVASTVTSANTALDETTHLLMSMDTTMSTAQETFVQLNDVMEKISNGEGSLGKLMNDQELYDNMELTTKNLQLLLQDVRLNPRRYFKLFGKKVPAYVLPEDDPAFKDGN